MLLLGCGRTDSIQTVNQSEYISDNLGNGAKINTDHNNKLGLNFSVVDVSPTGLKLICSQSGDQPFGILKTGSSYNLEIYMENNWYSVVPITDKYWQLQVFTIEKNQYTEFNIDWEWLYGKLEPGKYRLEKEIMDVKEPGIHDDYTYYAEFEINIE